MAPEIGACRVCCENFNSDSRLPSILPCGHTFCTLCLQRLIVLCSGGAVCCPTCRTSAPKMRTAEDFTLNFQYLKMLDEISGVGAILTEGDMDSDDGIDWEKQIRCKYFPMCSKKGLPILSPRHDVCCLYQ
eukprot:Rmarinus@m.8467